MVGTNEEMIIPAGGNVTFLIDSLLGGITLSSGDYIRIESDLDL